MSPWRPVPLKKFGASKKKGNNSLMLLIYRFRKLIKDNICHTISFSTEKNLGRSKFPWKQETIPKTRLQRYGGFP